METVSADIQVLYAKWRTSLIAALRHYRVAVHTLVDLACGTGNSTLPWLDSNRKVIGVDSSLAMLH